MENNNSEIQRIGIMLVHGIGDQQRHEHVNSVARHFIDMSRLKYGENNVSVTAHPGYKGRAPITINISEVSGKYPSIQLDFHEVWWRDLGDTKTFGRIIRFWFWALSIAGTRGQFCKANKEQKFPKNNSSEKNRVGISSRLKLFYTTTFFFVMLAPLWLITNIANIIPGLPRIRLFDSVFAYMSSVKLYQSLGDNVSGRLDDFNQPRRISIQRKVHEAFIHLYRQKYDRWYVAGHSLGSVIAFKAMFSGGHGFARLLNRNIWDFEVDEELKTEYSPPDFYPDQPKCPNWMSQDAAIRTSLLFENCAGFITWGSPLETFAHTWPATIPMVGKFTANKEFQWLNIYDAADIVASPLKSFSIDSENGEIYPINVSTKSHSLLAFSHTHYFHTKKLENAKDKVGFSILDWIVDGPKDFAFSVKDVGFLNKKADEQKRKFIMGVQCFIALIMGVLLWPKAMAFILNIIRKVIELILSIASRELADDFVRNADFVAMQLDDPGVFLNPVLDIKIVFFTGIFLIFCSLINYLVEPLFKFMNKKSKIDKDKNVSDI